VRLDVDEARANDPAAGVDLAPSLAGIGRFDGHDASGLDGDVGDAPGRTAAIDHLATTDDDVSHSGWYDVVSHPGEAGDAGG
jgi:hypothetical protein